jgi:hypothetical protein
VEQIIIQVAVQVPALAMVCSVFFLLLRHVLDIQAAERERVTKLLEQLLLEERHAAGYHR